MAPVSLSHEWLGVYRASAIQILCALRGALVANAASGAAVEFHATAHGVWVGSRVVRGGYSPDALAFATPALSYANCQALAAWLARQGDAPVSVARTADALQFSAPASFVIVAIEAPAPAALPRVENRLQALQREARQLGVSWADVRSMARDLAQRDAADDADALRRHAAQLLGVRGAWRRGLALLQRRIDRDGRDSDAVRGWDCVAYTLREEFPQYAGLDSADLFALVTNVTAPAKPADYYAEALGWIEAHGVLSHDGADCDAVPF